MSDLHIDLLIADAVCAPDYQAALLDQADRARVSAAPALAMRTDWQVSRFLKQQTKAPVLSLSHSHGAALLAAGAYPLPLGVDIEWLRPRDFSALADLSCSAEERQWLAARGWRAADYYRLWCTKEALIKAAGLDFPADLPHAGVCRQGGHTKLHIGGQSGWQGFAGLCGGWALACVWPDWASPQMRWQYFGTLAQPQHTVCKVWHFSPE